VGLWRPRQRPLPHQVRLDAHRPAPDGARNGVGRRPALADFWAKRRRRSNPPLASTTLRLLQAQDGRCPLCGTLLLHADQQPQHPEAWEQWFKAVRQAIRKSAVTADTGDGPPDEPTAPRLVHTHCRRPRGGPALLSACEPSGLA
jgi:hypothetical protein